MVRRTRDHGSLDAWHGRNDLPARGRADAARPALAHATGRLARADALIRRRERAVSDSTVDPRPGNRSGNGRLPSALAATLLVLLPTAARAGVVSSGFFTGVNRLDRRGERFVVLAGELLLVVSLALLPSAKALGVAVGVFAHRIVFPLWRPSGATRPAAKSGAISRRAARIPAVA